MENGIRYLGSPRRKARLESLGSRCTLIRGLEPVSPAATVGISNQRMVFQERVSAYGEEENEVFWY